MSTAGVVAADRGDPAGVGADVARPGLGDVEGPVGFQPHAGGGLDVEGRALLLPDVSETQNKQSVPCTPSEYQGHPESVVHSITPSISLAMCTAC